MRKPVYALCKQQRRRSACASAQSDQCLCCSLYRMYNISSFSIRNFKLKGFDYFNSHTKSMESALKRPRQANGWSSNIGYIFSFKPSWKTCYTVFLLQKHCSFRDVCKIGFIMSSVSVHVTFNASKLLFFILTAPIKKNRCRNALAGQLSTQLIPKHA